MSTEWPPYDLVDGASVAAARDKTRKLERLYHLTQEHAWDGRAVLGALVDRHGTPGRGLSREVRASLVEVLSILLWGELAAWTISADLALEIEELDAKMAATGQVFDEARHFTVLREYLLLLAAGDADPIPIPRLGGLARKLLLEVMGTKSLAKKLVGMQLLFETNAVVIFHRLADAKICPVLTELMPYFERDESRHVGLGVMYLPRLIARMSRTEAVETAAFQGRCLFFLIAGGMTLHPHFERLGLEPRLMATRVIAMQDDVVHQMAEAHGRTIARAILNPKSSFLGPRILDFIHPEDGLESRPPWHRTLHKTFTKTFQALDRAFA